MSTPAKKIKIFIGSSSESKEIAEYLQVALADHFEPTVWDQGIFSLTSTTMEGLMEAASTFDFAVLIFAADDVTRKRHLEKSAPRDNVIFEAGLFMGGLGDRRTFLVYCSDDNLHIPTDLLGITMAPFRRRDDGNLRAAINPAALKIKESVKKLGPRKHPIHKAGHEDSASSVALKHLSDGTRDLARGYAGIKLLCSDKTAIDTWISNVLAMTLDSFSTRQHDVYVAWLRPSKAPDILEIFTHKNLKTARSHYKFRLGEGLAGMVWKEGTAAATSAVRQHKWWVFREDCKNMSYVCSCVGEAGGSGGILAIGSDQGFDLVEGDELRVQAFGALLECGLRALDSSETVSARPLRKRQ